MVVIGKTDCLLEKSFCDRENVTGFPGLKFYKHGFGLERDEGVKYSGDRDFESLEMYVKESLGLEIDKHEDKDDNHEGGVVIEEGVFMLTNLTFRSVISSGDTFVQFCPPWSVPCQRLAKTWSDLALRTLKEDEDMKIAEIDCNMFTEVCEEERVNTYPTLIYYRFIIKHASVIKLVMCQGWSAGREIQRTKNIR